MTGWRIHLSPPDVGPAERRALLKAFDSGWIAPIGPQVDEFEAALARTCDVPAVAALASGTAALHLALRMVGVSEGDEVLVPSLTFIATASAAIYLGARCTFVDSEPTSWNVDPALVIDALDDRARRGCLPGAVVTVDLYGQAADHGPIMQRCRELGVPVVEDASEALGSTYRGRPAGSLADIGVLSFNGNKMITTSGGGALLGTEQQAERARWLASQARDAAPHYEHSEIGHNYRLSNLLAGLGVAQLSRLPELLERRHAVYERYRGALNALAACTVLPMAPWGSSNHWLTVVLVDPDQAGVDRESLRVALAKVGIEARPAWKPMHLQKVFAANELVGSGAVAERVFERGLCLPSGSVLTEAEQDEVVEVLAATIERSDR